MRFIFCVTRILALTVLASLVFTACAWRSGGELTGQEAGAPEAPTSLDALLPPPSQLVLHAGGDDRSTSFDESQYIRHGAAYDGTLPHGKVGVSNDNAKFSTSWSQANAGLDGLGYCIYDFMADVTFDREMEVHTGWHDPPSDYRDAWFGMADWTSDRWVWFPNTLNGVIGFGDITPYVNTPSQVLVVVAVANAEVSSLRWVRLGAPTVSAELVVTPHLGIASFEVEGNASASTAAAGTVDMYEWDWDGDGTFEDNSGGTATASHVYGAGVHHPVVQVTSSYGVTAKEAETATGYDPWAHTWGGDDVDQIFSVTADGTDGIYAAGLTWSFNDIIPDSDVLLLKYNLDGSFEWARRWGGEEKERANSVYAYNGAVYLVGYTNGHGEGMDDILIQRWDTDGNVTWTRTWGGGQQDWGYGVSCAHSAVYVSGATHSFGDIEDGDACLLKFDTDGNMVWDRAFGGSEGEAASCLVARYNFLSDSTTIYTAGFSESYSISPAVLYSAFKGDSSQLNQKIYSSAMSDYATSITTYGMLPVEIYIGGYQRVSDTKYSLLLKVDSGSPEVRFEKYTDCQAYGIVRSGDNLFLAGHFNDGTTGQDAYLATFGTDGSFVSAGAWDLSYNQDESFQALAAFPGSGLLFGGYSREADEGGWQAISCSLNNPNGAWSNTPTSPQTPGGTVNTYTETGANLSGGTLDSGGDLSDALIVAAPGL